MPSGRPLSAPSSSPRAQRVSPRSCWETIRTSSSAIFRIGSRKPASLAPIATMRLWSRGSSASSRRPRIGLDLPLDVRGTAFQHRVWQALQEIPIGETVSYAEIARRIGSPKAARAVADACAANNVAIAIPCHRVLRHDGSLSGYAWGVERRRLLLDREASRKAGLHQPSRPSTPASERNEPFRVLAGGRSHPEGHR